MRHRRSKNAEDLLSVATLGFRGEALPSIASVSRAAPGDACAEDASGTIVEINGGKIFKVEEAGIARRDIDHIRDLFFNIPARKKFLKAESHGAFAYRVAGDALCARASRQAF